MKPLIYLYMTLLLSACALANPVTGSLPTVTSQPTPSNVPAASPTLPPKAKDGTPLPAPLTDDAIAACPVTRPNGKQPLGETNTAGFDLGNEAGTLFTIPWPDGRVVFEPYGAGHRDVDGSLSMKWPWYRTVPGEVVIGGRRLDANAPPMPTVTLRGQPDGYGDTGFHPSSLTWPSEGCWEVTARVGDESLTFITLVIWLPFHP